MHPAPRTRLLAGLAALAVLAGLAILAVVTVLPPSPRTDTATTGAFIAARAFEDVETIGAAVHVAGSDAAAAVRGHIAHELDGMGVSAQVREGIGQTDALGGPAMAYVRDVVAEIPGSEPTGRLILMAHYDSVQVSYGANDDGSGVATLLEVARSLTSGPQLRNDVILLFTDAEEACLCGAESFESSDPLAADGGVVLNFESRGANGPSVMFETAAGNADLIAQYAAAVPYPVATSMAVEVYRILPNDTDFTPLRESGRFTGLNSAYIDGSAVYHSPEDRPQYTDLGTLQQHGANALALARQLGDADLGPLSKPGSQDATYFPVLGTLIRYPGTLVWPLAALAAAAVVAAGFLARRHGAASWGRQSAGFALMLLGIALLVVEAFNPTVVLGFGGVIAFLLGAVMLFKVEAPGYQLSWTVVGVATAMFIGLILVVLRSLWRARKAPAQVGAQAMRGLPAEVLDWNDIEGHVFTQGERWQAHGSEVFKPGEMVEVANVMDLTLVVRRRLVPKAGRGGV